MCRVPTAPSSLTPSPRSAGIGGRKRAPAALLTLPSVPTAVTDDAPQPPPAPSHFALSRPIVSPTNVSSLNKGLLSGSFYFEDDGDTGTARGRVGRRQPTTTSFFQMELVAFLGLCVMAGGLPCWCDRTAGAVPGPGCHLRLLRKQ